MRSCSEVMNCCNAVSCSGDRFNWRIMCSIAKFSSTTPRSFRALASRRVLPRSVTRLFSLILCVINRRFCSPDGLCALTVAARRTRASRLTQPATPCSFLRITILWERRFRRKALRADAILRLPKWPYKAGMSGTELLVGPNLREDDSRRQTENAAAKPLNRYESTGSWRTSTGLTRHSD